MHTIVPGTRTANARYKDAAEVRRGDVLARTGQRVVHVDAAEHDGEISIHLYTSVHGRRQRHPYKTFAGEVIPVRA
jgi:outer membrane cobalamin receptor